MNKKGFTLIELLIVIAIIGILAVAFLPTILNAPAKARDTQRVADLQNIQEAIINLSLDGKDFPSGESCVTAGFGVANEDLIKSFLGGSFPVDPTNETTWNLVVDGITCAKTYAYIENPGAGTTYSFGLYAKMENVDQANVQCSTIDGNDEGATLGAAPVADDACYAILVK